MKKIGLLLIVLLLTSCSLMLVEAASSDGKDTEKEGLEIPDVDLALSSDSADYTTPTLGYKMSRKGLENEILSPSGTVLGFESYSVVRDGRKASEFSSVSAEKDNKHTKLIEISGEEQSSFGDITYEVQSDKVKSTLRFTAPEEGIYAVVWSIRDIPSTEYNKTSTGITFSDLSLQIDWGDVVSSWGSIDSCIVKRRGSVVDVEVTFTLGKIEEGKAVELDPTVGTTTSTNSLTLPYQHRVFTAANRMWAWYYTGSNLIVYKSSSDGATWSSATTISSTGSSSQSIDVIYDGTYIHYALIEGTTLYHRAGTPHSNGTISWLTDLETVATVTKYNPSITRDTNGYIWIGLANSGSAIYRSTNTNGTFGSVAPGYPSNIFGSTGILSCAVQALTSGKVLAVAGYAGNQLRSCLYSGSTWGSPVDIDTTENPQDGYHMESDGNHIHLVYRMTSAGHSTHLKYANYSISASTWSTPAEIYHGSTISSPTLALNTDADEVYVFYPYNNKIYYLVKTTTWSTSTEWLDESTDTIRDITTTISAYPDAVSGELGVLYQTKSSSPYNIKFATLSVTLGNSAPIIGAFEAPENTYANKWFRVNATIMDANGVGDLYNATLKLSDGVGLRWETGDSWAEDDPSGYVTLDSASCSRTSLNSTAYKLSFRVKLDWDYPRGSFDIEASDTKVYDSLGASGSSGSVGVSTFENDVIVSGATVSDSRVNPSQSVSFTGTVYYRGTTTVPEDMVGVTAKVSLSGTLKGSTTSFTSGAFSVPVTAQSSVASYNYTVWAEAYRASTTNGTVELKVDGLNLSANVVDVAEETVKIRALYALDDTPIDGATVSFSGKTAVTNSSGWATFDTGLISTITANSTATGTSEPVYGLTTCTQTQTVSIQKIHVTPFAVTSGHVITNQNWNDVSLKLSFESSGAVSVDVGDYGTPHTVEVDSSPWTSWSYDSTDKRAIISGIGGLMVLTWESSPPSGGSPDVTPPITPPASNTTDTGEDIPVVTPIATLPTSTLVNFGIAAIVVTLTGFYVSQEMKNKNPLMAWRNRSKSPRKGVDWRKRK